MPAAVRWTLVLLAVLAAVLVAVSLWVSRALFDETLNPAILDDIAVAAPADALTFARTAPPQPRLLLVTQYRGGRVTGINLNARLGLADTDPIRLYQRFGYEALRAQTRSIADIMGVDAAALDVPFDAAEHNIGVGLNYPEHAREASLEERPFLFPKRARPTPAGAAIARGGSVLLDYEAELGFVALTRIGAAEPLPPLGLVLANEATDRWALVRNFRRGSEMGTTGFADGKSREGFAPLGNLFVIPRDVETFYRSIEMRLYLNGRLRQHESASTMSWGPRQILAETFRRAGWPFHHRDGHLPLLNAGGALTAGTILFSGTPGGVIFRPLNLWNPWVYLRPGDEVVIRADYLGVIRNRITE